MGTATSTAVPERAGWPRLATSPQPPLRPLLPRGYAGYTEATSPRHLVQPATTSVPLVVKLLDSAHRPPAFVMGPNLTRDFRQFTGTTPTQSWPRPVRDRQADP